MILILSDNYSLSLPVAIQPDVWAFGQTFYVRQTFYVSQTEGGEENIYRMDFCTVYPYVLYPFIQYGEMIAFTLWPLLILGQNTSY